MMKKALLLPFVAAFALAACTKEPEKTVQMPVCNHPSLAQTVRSQIQEIIKQEARAFVRNDSRQFVDADKIIAAASELQTALANAQAQSDGGKTWCSADLSIIIPQAVLEQAQSSSPLIYGDTEFADIISQKISGSNLNYENGQFSAVLHYLPDDKGGLTYEDNTVAAAAQTLSVALLPYGVKSILMIDGKAVSREDALKMQHEASYGEPPAVEDMEAAASAASQPAAEAVQTGDAEAATEILSPDKQSHEDVSQLSVSELESAREQNRQAEAEITQVWGSMERTVQQGLLSDQRVWIQNKQQNCHQAASRADSPAQSEYLQLQCDTRMTRERTQYLRDYTID